MISKKTLLSITKHVVVVCCGGSKKPIRYVKVAAFAVVEPKAAIDIIFTP